MMPNNEIKKEDYLRIARKFNFTKRELELGFLKVCGFSNRRIAAAYSAMFSFAEELFFSFPFFPAAFRI